MQLFIPIQNLIQLKSSQIMEDCQSLNLETQNFISSWSFPIRDFPTLFRNYVLSKNQALLLLIVIFFFEFCQPLYISITFFTFTPYATPKHSTLICIRYFSLLYWIFSFNLATTFFLINRKESTLLILLNSFTVTLYFCYFLPKISV